MSNWNTEQPILTPIFATKSAAIGGRIYVAGGRDTGRVYNTLQIYDLQTSTCENGPEMPYAKNDPSVIGYDGKLYVFGGSLNPQNSAFSNTVEVFDVLTGIWSSKAEMPNAGWRFAPVVSGTDIYLIGNAANGDNRIQIYDTVSNTWSFGAALPETIYAPTAQLHKGNIYIIGGNQSNLNVSGPSNHVWIYNIESGTFTIGSPITIGRTYASSVQSGDKIYLLGGYSNTALSDVSVYDIIGNFWYKDIPDLLPARHSFAASLAGNKIYVMGGQSNGTLDLTESIELPPEKLYVLIETGETEQLSINYNLLDNRILDWSSLNADVAAVNEDGLVTGVEEGMTHIEAASADGTYRDFVPVKIIDGKRIALHLIVNETGILFLAPNPLDVIWNSDNSNIATISDQGEVTAVSRGLVRMTGVWDGTEHEIYVRVNEEQI